MIPLAGFVFCQVEEGSRSFHAEGTGCEIGSWQVNGVFQEVWKSWQCWSNIGGKQEGLQNRAHGAGWPGEESRSVVAEVAGCAAPQAPSGEVPGSLGFCRIIRRA